MGPEWASGGGKGSLFNIHLCIHLHLSMKCVHKHTDIYDSIGLYTHKEVVVAEGGSTPYPSAYTHTYTHVYKQMYMT